MKVSSLPQTAKFSVSDKNTYRELFDSLFNPLCAFAYKYLSDPSEGQDLVQESFISLWEIKDEFDHFMAIKSFLYTTVRNKCLNVLKHRKVVQKHEEMLIYELSSDHFFVNHVIEEESFNLLYQEIEHLPPSSQKVMLLALRGSKNREIAAELGISENTVKTQKKIAYAKLKSKMSPVMNGILLAL